MIYVEVLPCGIRVLEITSASGTEGMMKGGKKAEGPVMPKSRGGKQGEVYPVSRKPAKGGKKGGGKGGKKGR